MNAFVQCDTWAQAYHNGERWTTFTVSNPKPYICRVPFCIGRTYGGSTQCSKCKKRLAMLNDPVKVVYNARRSRAAERGISWMITLDEFRAWCFATSYMQLSGKGNSDMQIDRIDESGPYSIDNIMLNTGFNNRFRNGEFKY